MVQSQALLYVVNPVADVFCEGPGVRLGARFATFALAVLAC